MKTVLEIYEGSDGEATTGLYLALEDHGPAGHIATNLFRATKCSERAKRYSRRYKGDAYQRKQWSMSLLCTSLTEHAESLGIKWGWGTDAAESFAPHVLYVDTPCGQISFHSPERGKGPDYAGKWDGQKGKCAGRAVMFAQAVLDRMKDGPPFPAKVGERWGAYVYEWDGFWRLAPMHPMEAIEQSAKAMGVETDPAAMDAARKFLDYPVRPYPLSGE